MRRLAAVAAAGLALLAGGAVVANETLLSDCDPQVVATIGPATSLDSAYRAAPSCSIVELQAGTYPTQRLSFDASKTSTDDVIFRPVAGAVVTIPQFLTGRYNVAGDAAKHFELRDLTIRDVQIDRDAEDVTLRDMSMDKFFIRAASDVTIVGGEVGPWVNDVATIFGCGGCPAPRDILIDSVVFHDFLIDNAEKHAECMQIWPSGASGIVIRNSIFRNCTDFGILVKAPNTGVVIEDSFFEAPMPGNVATTTCNPNCPRGGNSIRYSGATNTYPGSAVRDNIVNGGIGIDCNCVPLSNNRPGEIPLVPPGSPEPPPPTTTEPPPTETEPPPMSTYSDDFERSALGANWQNVSGASAGIINGDAGIVSGVFIILRWVGGPSPADQFSEAVISGGMTATELGRGVFVRRRSSDGARYQFHYDFDGTPSDQRPQWQLKYDGVPNASTRLLGVGFQAAPQAGDVLRIEAAGSEIRGYVNGVLYLAATDTALTAGDIGLASTTAGQSVSNQPAFARWAGGALTSSPSPPPPPDSLPLTIIAQDASTVTLGWTPEPGIGYRFLVDGVIVSHTWDAARSSVKFSKKPGAVLGVEAMEPGPNGTVVSP